MNIVIDGIIYQIQPRGGISRLFNEILPRMCEMDPYVRVSLLREGGELKQDLPEHPRIFHHVIPRIERYLRPWRVWSRHIQRIRRLVRELCVGRGSKKIWHSTYYTLPERWLGKQVVTVHDMIHERFPGLFDSEWDEQFRKRKRECVLAADSIICISETTRLDVERFYGLAAAKVKVVPNGYSSLFKPLTEGDCSYKLPTGRPFLLYVGRRIHYKNFNGLLRAYANWPGQKHVDLIAVGGGKWNAEERQLLAGLKLGERVHLLGYIDDATLCYLYNLAVAFVYPSFYEGFGIPLLEAMACGCPIVASHIPSSVEVAGDYPIYFDPADSYSLIEALNSIQSEGRGSPRCLVGLRRAAQYTWDVTAEKTLDLYYELCGSGRPAR